MLLTYIFEAPINCVWVQHRRFFHLHKYTAVYCKLFETNVIPYLFFFISLFFSLHFGAMMKTKVCDWFYRQLILHKHRHRSLFAFCSVCKMKSKSSNKIEKMAINYQKLKIVQNVWILDKIWFRLTNLKEKEKRPAAAKKRQIWLANRTTEASIFFSL